MELYQALKALPDDFAPEVTKRAFIETAFEHGLRDGFGTVNGNPYVPDSPVHTAYEFGFNEGQRHGTPVADPASRNFLVIEQKSGTRWNVNVCALNPYGKPANPDRELWVSLPNILGNPVSLAMPGIVGFYSTRSKLEIQLGNI